MNYSHSQSAKSTYTSLTETHEARLHVNIRPSAQWRANQELLSVAIKLVTVVTSTF
jgi:hypothetical protein